MDSRAPSTLSLHRTDRNNLLPGEWQHFPAAVALSLPRSGNAQSLGISKTESKHTKGTVLQILMRQFHLCHLNDQALEHDAKGRESSWVQWNEIVQSWSAWAMHFLFCANSTDLWPMKEEKKKKTVVLPLAFSPCGCLAADSSQKTTMQLQIILPPAYICMWKSGRWTGNSL